MTDKHSERNKKEEEKNGVRGKARQRKRKSVSTVEYSPEFVKHCHHQIRIVYTVPFMFSPKIQVRCCGHIPWLHV